MKKVIVFSIIIALIAANAACSGTVSQTPEATEALTPSATSEDLSGESTGSSVTADIDKDGEIEELLLLDGGYGIYRINIYAIKNDVPHDRIIDLTQEAAYHVTYVPDPDYAELKLVKISDTEVHLSGVVFTDDGAIPGKDYGPLLVRGDELYVDAQDFPFKTWKEAYGSLTE